jgi:hypothetical protein
VSETTSATGGYLHDTEEPLYGEELADFVQAQTASLTGLAPSMVRPRWQPNPPQQPAAEEDWCAIGITSYTSQDFPVEILSVDDAGNSSVQQGRSEQFECLASFYGAHCHALAARLRDALYLGQNLEQFYTQNIKLVGAGTIVEVPELVNMQWINRVDLSVTFRRIVTRSYAIEPIAGAPWSISVNKE